MIYSDNFVCFFKHVTQIEALKFLIFFFLHLTPETSNALFENIHKTSIFTLSECKYISTTDMRGERKEVGGIKWCVLHINRMVVFVRKYSLNSQSIFIT